MFKLGLISNELLKLGLAKRAYANQVHIHKLSSNTNEKHGC